jgi:hypothetical protein
MKEVIEELEEVIDSGLSSIDAESWPGRMYNKRLWELYIGFLYGHPIWTRSEKHSIEEDFEQLALLWDDGRWDMYDLDASDAAMDAIRELVTQHGEELTRPFNILGDWNLVDGGDTPYDFLMDFMVYGHSGSVCGKWYDAYVSDKDDGSIDEGLAGRFSEKAGAKAEGNKMPDLMECCRYHRHELDERCYLDK